MGLVQGADDVITEKGAVHPYFDNDTGQRFPYLLDTVQNERLCAIGIMHIARAVQYIEHLPGLSDSTEQRIIAALPLLLFVEADRSALGGAAGANHGTIKVQREASQSKRLNAIENQGAQYYLKIIDTPGCR